METKQISMKSVDTKAFYVTVFLGYPIEECGTISYRGYGYSPDLATKNLKKQVIEWIEDYGDYESNFNVNDSYKTILKDRNQVGLKEDYEILPPIKIGKGYISSEDSGENITGDIDDEFFTITIAIDYISGIGDYMQFFGNTIKEVNSYVNNGVKQLFINEQDCANYEEYDTDDIGEIADKILEEHGINQLLIEISKSGTAGIIDEGKPKKIKKIDFK